MAASTTASKARPRPTAKTAAEPRAVPFEPLADSLGYAIKRAQVRTYALLFRIFDNDCLSPGRMTALWMIASDPRINQSTLAQRLSITRASVVKVVDSLEQPGLVQRLPVPGDRRSYALVVTALGLRELERHREAHARFEAELATALTRNERRQLMELLEKVAAA